MYITCMHDKYNSSTNKDKVMANSASRPQTSSLDHASLTFLMVAHFYFHSKPLFPPWQCTAHTYKLCNIKYIRGYYTSIRGGENF